MAMAQATSGKRRSFYADLDHLKSHFDSIDHSQTGYIGYNELKQLARKMSGIKEADLPQLMNKLDRDEDGKVGVSRKGGVALFACRLLLYVKIIIDIALLLLILSIGQL